MTWLETFVSANANEGYHRCSVCKKRKWCTRDSPESSWYCDECSALGI